MEISNIAVFASGAGSNAMRLHDYFKNSKFRISLIVTNNPTAGVIEKAKDAEIPVLVHSMPIKEEEISEMLQQHRIDAIILAGYLKLIPDWLIAQFPDKIINIHPSLLPAYGGKGMYGMHVHESVLQNGDKASGITIHLVNHLYDKGRILLQKRIDISKVKTAGELAHHIHQLEYHYFPPLVEAWLSHPVSL